MDARRSPSFHRFSSGRDCGSSGHERRSRKFSRRGTRAMAENRLIIELTYSNRGDGDWSHQIDIFRQIEIERLAAEEEILPSGERLDADEIESLLGDEAGDSGEALKLMVSFYGALFA